MTDLDEFIICDLEYSYLFALLIGVFRFYFETKNTSISVRFGFKETDSK